MNECLGIHWKMINPTHISSISGNRENTENTISMWYTHASMKMLITCYSVVNSVTCPRVTHTTRNHRLLTRHICITITLSCVTYFSNIATFSRVTHSSPIVTVSHVTRSPHLVTFSQVSFITYCHLLTHSTNINYLITRSSYIFTCSHVHHTQSLSHTLYIQYTLSLAHTPHIQSHIVTYWHVTHIPHTVTLSSHSHLLTDTWYCHWWKTITGCNISPSSLNQQSRFLCLHRNRNTPW